MTKPRPKALTFETRVRVVGWVVGGEFVRHARLFSHLLLEARDVAIGAAATHLVIRTPDGRHWWHDLRRRPFSPPPRNKAYLHRRAMKDDSDAEIARMMAEIANDQSHL